MDLSSTIQIIIPVNGSRDRRAERSLMKPDIFLVCSMTTVKTRAGYTQDTKGTSRPRVGVDVARIGRLRAQRRSIREIANELGYSRSLVHKTLANRGSGRVANAAS